MVGLVSATRTIPCRLSVTAYSIVFLEAICSVHNVTMHHAVVSRGPSNMEAYEITVKNEVKRNGRKQSWRIVRCICDVL
jgi:hypothetical protein